MSKYFHVTYDITSYESAENGDYEEMGYVMPGNWHHKLEPDDGSHHSDYAMTLREAVNLVGVLESSGGTWLHEADGYTNYRTGDHERRAFHMPENITNASYFRIMRVLTSERRLLK